MNFEQVLETKLAELAGIADGVGYPIELGIIETVAALQVLGFATKASCEGHNPRGSPWPWVDLMPSLPKPVFRWVGEEQVHFQALSELGLTEEDIGPGQHRVESRKLYRDRVWDWVDEVRPRQTAAYGVWQDSFHQDYLRLMGLIRDFERQSPADIWLVMNILGLGTWARLEVIDEASMRDSEKSMVKNHIEPDVEVQGRLELRQARMREFTAFLMAKARALYSHA